MRIAYLSSSCIPSESANSIHVMKMAHAIAGLGHEVRLIAPDKKDGFEDGAVDSYAYYGVTKNFDIHRERWVSFKGRGYWYGWRAALAAKRWGAHFAYGRNTAACFFAALAGLPVLYESHFPVDEEGRLNLGLFTRLIRNQNFRGLVVITHALKRHYEERWPELQGRITVAADGADPLHNSLEPISLPVEGSRLQVGYAGSLYPGKGMEVVIPLARQSPWADFHIIGGGTDELAEWLGSEGCPPNLLHHGYQPPGVVPRYLLAMDVLLLPNQCRVELRGGKDIGRWTSPLKAFEYMAAGRAILCSNVPVLREVLVDGRNALLCSADRIEEWIYALKRLSGDAELRERLGTAARFELEQIYSWPVRARRVVSSAGFESLPTSDS